MRRIVYIEADANGAVVHSAEIASGAIGYDAEGDAVVESKRAEVEAAARANGRRLVFLTEDSRRPVDLDALTVDARGLWEKGESVERRAADPTIADPLARVWVEG